MPTSTFSDLSREVRVFISSTFRDMDSERNYLVKSTFPQLRKRCSERGVEFTELDLRWGVTEEEAKQGKIIKICLNEIDRCRPSMPFFIGILGERYGWIPDHVDLEKHREILDDFGWVEKDVENEMSITEMEMQYAVLRNPRMKGKAFFFLRKNENIPEEFYEKSGSLAAEKLNKLKNLLREQKDFPVHNYHSNEELGKLVEEELWSVLEQYFPTEFDNDPLTLTRKEHAIFARSRTTIYIGGEKYYQKLDNHFDSDKQPIVITGAGGMGKSALLANWLKHFREQNPEIYILQYYIGGAPDSTDHLQLIRHLLVEMKKEFEVIDEIPSESDKLKDALPLFFAQCTTKGKWILVLDALNQIEDRDNAKLLNWLPDFIPPLVRVYISSTTGSTLELIQKREWETITIEPLTIDDRKELISSYLTRYSKNLPIETVNRIAEDKESENPLILRTLLDELRIFGKHRELNQRIEYYISTKSPEEFFDRVLERMEMDYESDHKGMVGEILSLIYCARKGISEKELMEITNIPPLYWSPLYIALENLLVSHGGLLNISHDFFSKAIESRYITNEVKEKLTHQKLANYFLQDKYDSRAFDELVYQLTYSEEWDEVIKILTDFNYFMEMCKDNKLEGILDDYQLVFFNAPESVKNELKLWHSFFKERMHILRRDNKQWPSYKILFQLAMEHAYESPISKQAEAYLVAGKVDWLWLFRAKRLKESQINPCIAILEGHSGYIEGAIELMDGRILTWSGGYCGRDDNNLRLWNPNGQLYKIMEQDISDYDNPEYGALQMSNGTIITWSGSDLWNYSNKLRAWDKDGNILGRMRDDNFLEIRHDINEWYGQSSLKLSNGDTLAWFWDEDDILVEIEHKDGDFCNILKGHNSNIEGVIELLDGRLISWDRDNILILWDILGNQLTEFIGHSDVVYRVLELSDGRIITRSKDKTIRLWKIDGSQIDIYRENDYLPNDEYKSTQENIKKLLKDLYPKKIHGSIELSNNLLLTWSEDILQIWDVELIQKTTQPKISSSELNGTLVIFDREIYLRKENTLHCLRKESRQYKILRDGNWKWGTAIRLTDGRMLLCEENKITLWNAEKGQYIRELGNNEKVNGIIELQDGQVLSWSLVKNTIRKFNVDSGQCINELKGHKVGVWGVVKLSNDMILSWSSDRSLRIWDSATGICKCVLEGHTETVLGAFELANGEILSWSSEYSYSIIRTWDKKGNFIKEILVRSDLIVKVCELQDGQILAICKNGIERWHLPTKSFLESLSYVDFFHGYPELCFYLWGKSEIHKDILMHPTWKKGILLLYRDVNTVIRYLQWHGDDGFFPRYLLSDGFVIATNDKNHVCFFDLFDGKKRITLSELEEKIKSP